MWVGRLRAVIGKLATMVAGAFRVRPELLLDLLLPTVCVGCGEPGAIWCARCRPRPAPPARLAGPQPPRDGPQPPPMFAMAAYRGTVRAALIGYKERGHRGLVGVFGQWLADGLEALPAGVRCEATGPDGCWWLVPVPSRRRAAARRGGQHVAAVTAAAAAVLAARGRPVVVSAPLRMSRAVRDSVGLDAAARRANLAGRVLLRPDAAPPPGTVVLLVDDIVTTATTAAACVERLHRSSVRVAAVVALAAAGGHPASRWTGPARSQPNRTGG